MRRIGLIELCTQAGFSLDETRVLLTDRARRGGQRKASRALAERKLSEIEEQIAQLRVAQDLIGIGLRCTCQSLEDCACDADVWCLLST